MKTCWLTNIPSPYKTVLFQQLNAKAELFVVFEKENEQDREAAWVHSGSFPFQAVFLKDAGKDLPNNLADQYDLLINGDYSSRLTAPFVKAFHRRRKPVVMQADGGLAIRRPLLDPVIRTVMNRNDWFLSSGPETDKYYSYYHVPAARILHYPFSSLSQEDISRHHAMRQERDRYRQICGYQEPFIIFSAGQQIHRKGYDILARAAMQLDSSIGIYIAGGTPEKEVQALIEANHLSGIHFMGFKDKQALENCYAGADLFVLPTRYDIWGLVVNEALSFGLPVISTDRCVAALEFSHQGNAVRIVPTEDADALHHAIADCFADAHLRSEMAEDALRLSNSDSIENSVSALYLDFQTVLGSLGREGKQKS